MLWGCQVEQGLMNNIVAWLDDWPEVCARGCSGGFKEKVQRRFRNLLFSCGDGGALESGG